MAIVRDKIEPVKTYVFSRCEKAQKLIDAGEYESAAAALGDLWKGVGKTPYIIYLSALEKAEVLLIAGSLTGWLGSVKQIENSQEKAKDLISEAASIFETAQIFDKWAEARSDLAVCYWREGSFDEARIILQDALEKVSPQNYSLRGQMILRQVNVEISAHQYQFARLLLEKSAEIIQLHGTDLLRGKLYFHQALVLRRLAEEENKPEYLDKAVENYKKESSFQEAKKCFEEAANSAQAVGDTEDAGAALLTLIEELRERLSDAEARDFCLRAEEILPKTSRNTTLLRLKNISREFLQPGQKSFIADKDEKWKGFSLPAEVKKFEAKIVFEALQDADGKVTKAAEFLGISHQTLSLLLKQRHRNLAAVKKPRKPRTIRPRAK